MKLVSSSFFWPMYIAHFPRCLVFSPFFYDLASSLLHLDNVFLYFLNLLSLLDQASGPFLLFEPHNLDFLFWVDLPL